jgi:hypothetical protein
MMFRISDAPYDVYILFKSCFVRVVLRLFKHLCWIWSRSVFNDCCGSCLLIAAFYGGPYFQDVHLVHPKWWIILCMYTQTMHTKNVPCTWRAQEIPRPSHAWPWRDIVCARVVSNIHYRCTDAQRDAAPTSVSDMRWTYFKYVRVSIFHI